MNGRGGHHRDALKQIARIAMLERGLAPDLTPAALAEALSRMPLRSLFYHVHEAHRRRKKDPSDDFSAWLEGFGADESLVAHLRQIDFYFLNLSQLRQEFIEAFLVEQPAEPQAILKATL